MRKIVVTLFAGVVLAGVGVFEWRYSDDMQEHINTVNRDLDEARNASLYSSGLFASLEAMKLQIQVGTEIIETHEHVHTLKDEVLAGKIRKAIEKDGMTVGGAAYTTIQIWPDII